MKFHTHHFFSSLRIFYVKMATSEGRGVCISLTVTRPSKIIYTPKLDNLQKLDKENVFKFGLGVQGRDVPPKVGKEV